MSAGSAAPSIEEILRTHTKQSVVANMWLVAPGLRYQTVARILGTSNEHARRTYRAMESGDIPIEDVADADLQSSLIAVLEAEDTEGEIQESVEIRTTSEEVPDWWIDSSRRQVRKRRDTSLPGNKQDRVVAAYMLHRAAGEEFTNRTLSEIAECAEEHARRVRTSIEEGSITGEDIKTIPSEVWAVVVDRLSFDVDAESVQDLKSNPCPPTDESATAEAEGMVPASKLVHVRDVMSTLRREAEYSGNAKAEFVANEAITRLDSLLDRYAEGRTNESE